MEVAEAVLDLALRPPQDADDFAMQRIRIFNSMSAALAALDSQIRTELGIKASFEALLHERPGKTQANPPSPRGQ
jgi:hypothetical protein